MNEDLKARYRDFVEECKFWYKYSDELCQGRIDCLLYHPVSDEDNIKLGYDTWDGIDSYENVDLVNYDCGDEIRSAIEREEEAKLYQEQFEAEWEIERNDWD